MPLHSSSFGAPIVRRARITRRRALGLVLGGGAALAWGAASAWDDWIEKRVAVVTPGRLVRGAWQRPRPLRRIVERERVRTIVTLTAINRDDPKYVAQAEVVRKTGVEWIIVPMRGSRATLAQMAEAADLLADPMRQPVFFHCVAGHHRTSLVHAAYRIRHEGYSASRAWTEVEAFPWARTETDQGDRCLIEEFAAWQARSPQAREAPGSSQAASTATGEKGHDNARQTSPVGNPRGRRDAPARLSRLSALEPGPQ